MPALGKILIIDDNEDVLFALHLLLEPYAEKVKVMRSPDRIVHFITDFRPDIVLLDMNFTRDTVSGQEGMDCLQEILKLDRHAVVVMMTAYADTDKAVQAIKAGATDFVSKPWENDKLLATLHAAMKLRRSQTEVGRLEERVEALSAERETPQPLLIGESEGMRNIVSTIGRLREADVNVLLLGENGTGKDVVARYLLAHSSRAAEPFVTIDPARPRGHRHRLVRRRRARGMDEPGGYGTSRYMPARAGGMVAAVRTGGARSTGGTPRADERPPALAHTLHFG